MTEVWICGQWVGDAGEYFSWEFHGVFSSREKAMAACRNEHYFIAPIELDKKYPHGTEQMPGAYYPLAEGGE